MAFTQTYDWSKTSNISAFWAKGRDAITRANGGTATGHVPRLPQDFDDISYYGINPGYNGAGGNSLPFQYLYVPGTTPYLPGQIYGRWVYGLQDLFETILIALSYGYLRSPNGQRWLYAYDESLDPSGSNGSEGILKAAGCPVDNTGIQRGWTTKLPARIAQPVTSGAATQYDPNSYDVFYVPVLGQVAWCETDGLKYKLQSVSGTNTWVICDQLLSITTISYGCRADFGRVSIGAMAYIGPWMWTELDAVLTLLLSSPYVP